eukprot:106562_1
MATVYIILSILSPMISFGESSESSDDKPCICTNNPTSNPLTLTPTSNPSGIPTRIPTGIPTRIPTGIPTTNPVTLIPTQIPTTNPLECTSIDDGGFSNPCQPRESTTITIEPNGSKRYCFDASPATEYLDIYKEGNSDNAQSYQNENPTNGSVHQYLMMSTELQSRIV